MRPKIITDLPPLMGVTAIVPAHNEAEHIKDTIVSLQKQTYPLTDIIVVDDCSTDGTGEIARACGVHVVRPEVNQGSKPRAQSYALPLVKTELFLTVDADTTLAPNALHEAMRCFNDSAAEVVSGAVIPRHLKTFWELGRLIDYLYAQTIVKPAQDQNNLVLVAIGCFSIFRTETVRKLGGFNNRTIAEDMDMTWLIQEDGGKVYYASKALCFAVDPPTFKIYVQQMNRWYRGFMQNIRVRGFRIFPRKKSMMVAVYFYLLWLGIGTLGLPILLWSITGDFVAMCYWLLTMNAAFVWTPAFIKGLYLKVPWTTTVKGFVPYLVIPYINTVIYLWAIWKELIIGDRLTIWQKGH